MGEDNDMTVSMSSTTRTVKGVLVDPPLGVVTIDLTDDRVEMKFSNAHIESFPLSAVGFIGHEDRSIALNWAGTPIVMRCGNPDDTNEIVDHFSASDPELEGHDGAIRAHRLGYGGILGD